MLNICVSWLRNFFRRIREIFNPLPRTGGKVLPWGVHEALKAQNSLLYPKDLSILAQCGGYTDVLIYLVTKALHGMPEAQFSFLADVYNCTVRVQDDETDALIVSTIGLLDPLRGVESAKLWQLNRQGFELWDEMYRAAARASVDQRKDIVMVAYATMIGFRQLVRAYRGTDRAILLVSHRHFSAGFSFFGYRFGSGEGSPVCSLLDEGTRWPSEFVLLEDTIKQGTTMRMIRTFIELRAPSVCIDEVILARTTFAGGV